MINLIIWQYGRNLNVRHYLCLNPFVPFMHTLYMNMIYYNHLVVQIIKSTCASFSYIINYIVDIFMYGKKKTIGFGKNNVVVFPFSLIYLIDFHD